jgi:hypothetical protein
MAYFTDRTIGRARDRQYPRDGYGAKCAKCGVRLVGENGRYYAIPRIPIEQRGTGKIENCVVLCSKCYLDIVPDYRKEIPWEELPYYQV